MADIWAIKATGAYPISTDKAVTEANAAPKPAAPKPAEKKEEKKETPKSDPVVNNETARMSFMQLKAYFK